VATLDEREQAAIRDAFATLEREVEVLLELGPSAAPVTLLAAGGREIDSNTVTREIAEAVCALCDRVSLSVVEHDEPGRWPRLTIGPGLVYQGMPLGYELTSLVHAIVEAGRAESSLLPASRDQLATLARDVAIDVFVTPT
jgi:alkyl hydroperoxide reductase subunit AhpF